MTVDDEVHFSSVFLDSLAELAHRLNRHDIAIYDLAYHYWAFGSWTLVAGRPHRRLRFQFDGKEEALSISQSDFSDSQSQANWKALQNPALPSGAGVDPAQLFDVVERVLVDNLKM